MRSEADESRPKATISPIWCTPCMPFLLSVILALNHPLVYSVHECRKSHASCPCMPSTDILKAGKLSKVKELVR
eukprot:scaffold8251_cov23-Prasinocladus_malaysianus.AAC.1